MHPRIHKMPSLQMQIHIAGLCIANSLQSETLSLNGHHLLKEWS